MGLVRFSVKTREKTQFIDIGGEVARIVAAAGVEEGICQVSVPHTTAAVTVNENADPSVVRDMLMELNKVIPFQDGYHHLEGNSAAHIKSSLLGCALTLPVSGGRLVLGRWQGLFFCEFDGPRTRNVQVQVVGG
jgi:secondary thiamine-phosphate synthase enzyme